MLPAALLMPGSPSNRRRLLASLAVVLFASFAYVAPASANATINVALENLLPRTDPSGKTISNWRATTLHPEAVNFQDCVDDHRLRFPLTMSGFEPLGHIEVWASNGGVDCGQQLNRSSANQLCWRVAPDVPLQQAVDVVIPVRKVMSGAPPFKAIQPDETENVCGKVDLTNLTVQFLYFAPAQTAAAASKKDVQIQVDTVGPAPPTGIKTKPGNTRVQVQWDNISGEGGVSVLTGVQVFCDPVQPGAAQTITTDASCTDIPIEASVDPDAEAGTVDAGFETVCTDGGSETVAGGACSTPNFVSSDGKPITPDAEFGAKYGCGSSFGNTGTTVEAKEIAGQPLENGKTYAVAVAGTDAYGNVGVLSSVFCEKPAETTDFWEAYRDSGGSAGGGFCATSGAGAPTGSIAAFGLVIAAAVSMLRRKSEERR
jgi:hypothetical protein